MNYPKNTVLFAKAAFYVYSEKTIFDTLNGKTLFFDYLETIYLQKK